MQNLPSFRKYGNGSPSVILVHGGPGATGDLEIPAKKLSKKMALIESLHHEKTLEGQIKELKILVDQFCDKAVVLLGHSWGAWLVYMFAARYPELVRKIVLVSSGPMEGNYTSSIATKRLQRMNKDQLILNRKLQKQLKTTEDIEKNKVFSSIGALIQMVDSYQLDPEFKFNTHCQYQIYQGVYPDAFKIRNDGRLLAMGKSIKCPVVAIHGTYDSHPPEGVEKPLQKILPDFTFYILDKCGHYPWLEVQARNEFYKILEKVLN